MKTKYYNAPIELYRHFLEDSDKCLFDVLAWCAADYDTVECVEDNLEISEAPLALISRGRELRELEYSGCKFSPTRELFWEYYKKKQPEEKKVRLLGYLALKTLLINGIFPKITYNKQMFARMAGYTRFIDLSIDEVGTISKYYNPKRLARIRADIEETYSNVHIFTKKGMRGFALDISDSKRDDALEMLAKKVITRTEKAKQAERAKRNNEAYKQAMRQLEAQI